MDPMDFYTKTTSRGSRGGSGPSGFSEFYTGAGSTPPRPKAAQARKQPRTKPCGHQLWQGCLCELLTTFKVHDADRAAMAEGELAVAS